MAAWRGVEDGPLVDLPVQEISALIPDIIRQTGIADRLRLDEVVAAWRGIVGDFLAQSSQPDSISRGVLCVRILQPAVHHALMMEKGKILARLKAHLGASAVKDIRFRHG